MRRIRYQVAASLDGYIAGPKGEIDWIVTDPEFDFQVLYRQFDTVLMGRKTYEAARAQGPGAEIPGMQTYVFSRTLRQADCPDAIVSDSPQDRVPALKKRSGKDIWLFGGGSLFRSLLDLGLVDTVEVAVLPVLLGRGLPLLPRRKTRAKLALTTHQVYERTGTVQLEYAVL